VQISDGAVNERCTCESFRRASRGRSGGNGYSDDGVVLYTPTQAETNYTVVHL
jgi:hypothetical protein